MAGRNAIGILETKGFAPLVLGADAVGSGYVAFVVEGDVAAVRSAIEAANEAASRVGEVMSQLVIPRPDDALEGTFNRGA